MSESLWSSLKGVFQNDRREPAPPPEKPKPLPEGLDEGTLERAAKQFVRNRDQNQKLGKYFDSAYRANYSKETLAERRFLNLGAGNFKHKYWRVADRTYGDDNERWTVKETGIRAPSGIDHYFDFSAGARIDVEEGFFEVAYTSHALEHVENEHVQFVLAEACRILKPGGILRVTVPDISLAKHALETGDRFYFPWLKDGEPIEIAIVRHCSLAADPSLDNLMSGDEAVAHFANRDFYEALDALHERVPPGANKELGRHVNWFNPEKLTKMLLEAGFSNVYPSAYGQSLCPVLRDTRRFDKTRPSMSLYVDAVK